MGETVSSLGETRLRIVLVGMMGTGKSTVGRCLAEHLGVPLVDSDDWIERHTGRTVREIWQDDGVEAFRDLESRVLGEALAAPGPAVVAAAGGTVLSEANRRLLREHDPVVWMRAEVPTIVARLASADQTGTGAHRPLIGDDPALTVPGLDAQRRAYYAEVADHVVDVDGLSADEVCRRIAAAVAP